MSIYTLFKHERIYTQYILENFPDLQNFIRYFSYKLPESAQQPLLR